MIYKFRRAYECGKTRSSSFLGILPKELTITPQKWYHNSQPVDVHTTMFGEVWLIPYWQDRICKEIMNKRLHPYKSLRMRDLYMLLKKIVYKNWEVGRFHVVSHSSGVDSRILSYIIMELADEFGSEWLGDVLFVENGGEADNFKKIMNIEGWDKSQYLVYNENANPDEYHKYGLTFEHMVNKFNGVSGFPFNVFYDSYHDLMEQGIIPNDAQFFSGFGQYIEQIYKKGVKSFLRTDYYLQMQMFNLLGDWVFPYWDLEYILELSFHREVYVPTGQRICDLINRAILPNMLANVHNVKVPEVVKRGYRSLSRKVLRKIQKEYDNSWYGSNRKLQLTTELMYSNLWGAYNEAAICQYIINNNHELTWQKR